MWSWLSSKISSSSSEITLAQAEVSALESFYDQLFADLNDQLTDRDALQFSKTWKGRLMNASGYVFSLICVFKVLSVRDSSYVVHLF